MPEIAYVNGIITPLAVANIPVSDVGFRLGYGVFETFRGYNDKLFRLDAHLKRMQSGAAFLGIEVDVAEIEVAVRRTLDESRLDCARVRLTVTGGQADKATVVVTVEKYKPPTDDDYRRGLAAVTTTIRRHSDSQIYRYKTLNQIENSVALAEARSKGTVEAILFNESGEVTETNRSNIFLVRNGVLKTPDLDSGILPGITRDTVLKIAVNNGIETVEGRMTPTELINADEVFITSSLIEVMPLTSVDGVIIGSGKIGQMTELLRLEYQRKLTLA